MSLEYPELRRQPAAMCVPKIAALASVMALAVAGVVAVAPGAQAACGSGTYGGGSGTSGDPYVIASGSHLKALQSTSGDWSCGFVQTEPIDLTGTTWSSGIGSGSGASAFSGTYDGGNHEISGLVVDVEGSYAGLFGYVTGTVQRVSFSGSVEGEGNYIGGIVGIAQGGTVESSSMTGTVTATTDFGANVGGVVGQAYNASQLSGLLSEATVTSESNITGGVVGWLSTSDLTDSSFGGSVSADIDQVGGLVGWLTGSGPEPSISDSYSTGTVVGRWRVGGAVGQALSGSIERVYATGSVTGNDGSSTYIGGLVGDNDESGSGGGGATITDSYARGSVEGNNIVGGLLGGGRNTITNSYATGSISAPRATGGLSAQGGDAIASFWDTDTTGESSSAGGGGVVGKTTAQMTSLPTFLDASWSIAQGYDETKTWGIDADINDGYPFLVSLYSSYLEPSSGSTSTSGPRYEFTFWLPTGEQCTAISPQSVQRGAKFTLPGALAGCRREGTEIAGWTVPWGDRVYPPGTVVTAVDSQQFTAVLKEPAVTVLYDANVAATDGCWVDGVEVSLDDRVVSEELMRDALVGWPLRSGAPCTPDEVELQGWNTRGDGTGEELQPGNPVPATWAEADDNQRHLYAVWGR
jgi:hypothetical protein